MSMICRWRRLSPAAGLTSASSAGLLATCYKTSTKRKRCQGGIARFSQCAAGLAERAARWHESADRYRGVLRCSRMHSSDSFSRRTFLAATSGLALARGASSKDRLRAGRVGCGGRGTQAVVNLLTGNENVDLVAMADVFEDHLEGSLERLRTNDRYMSRDAGITVERNGKSVQMTAQDLIASIRPRIKVDAEHHFVGFDAFQKLIN